MEVLRLKFCGNMNDNNNNNNNIEMRKISFV